MNKVLIVEDEPDIREAMSIALTESGFDVLQAANGLEGLKLAIAEEPDVILLDLIMPEMDGITTLQKLRAHPWGRNVKVLILTNMDDAKNIALTHEYNISDYVIKSHHSLKEIMSKVRETVLL